MFILIATAGYMALAVVALLDKFIVSKEKLTPEVYAFFSSAPVLPILLLIPFGVHPLASAADYAIAFVSGGAFAGALYAMYRGFETNEVSHGGPLVGAAIPFFSIFLSELFLKERVSTVQLVAIVILILGSLIISFEQTQKNSGWKITMLWLVVAGLGYALSNVAAKFLYDRYGFYSGFVWSRAMLGIAGLCFIAFRKVRTSLVHRASSNSSHTKLISVIADKGLGFVGALLVQWAIAMGSVSLVNALSGLQYAFLIILVALLTRFAPRIFKEDYRQGEFVQEGLAVICIGIGLALLLV